MPVPLATYRLQLTPTFGFDAARAALAHLVALGVSHVYLSPVMRAVPGSRHGYDVIDPHLVDLERGGEHAFHDLATTAHDMGLGVLLDVVPNHLAADPRSPAWSDVIRHGRASGMARWFDIAWAYGTAQVPDRLLLPVLDTDLDGAIASGTVRLGRTATEVVLCVGDQMLPLSNESIAEIVDAVASAMDAGPSTEDVVQRRFAGLAHELQRRMLDPDHSNAAVDDHRMVCVLGALAGASAEIGEEIDALLAAMSSDGATLSWVLDRQHYQLADWRTATTGLDRRRFFDVSDLVGVRQEDPEVFAATHGRVLAMVHAGLVDGLRVDHPDGLADPKGYVERLRHEIGDRWLVVEKILSPDEEVPASWPVDGTTGYEHAAVIDRVFVAPGAESLMTATVADLTADALTATERSVGEPGALGAVQQPAQIVLDATTDALLMLFETELRRLTGIGSLVVQLDDGPMEDDPSAAVRRALVAAIVACPVYRTYVRPGAAADPHDTPVLDRMFESARRALTGDPDAQRLAATLRSVFDRGERTESEEAFVARFQQLTSAVRAKGVEDTACYRLPRLLSLCDVGGDPLQWSVSVEVFHAQRARTAEHSPRSMVVTSTHDSKRSADARARLTALSEMPDRWATTAQLVRDRIDTVLGTDGGDPLLDLLFVELALAIDPGPSTAGGVCSADLVDAPLIERLQRAASKAAREAKRRTSWHRPDAAYETRVEQTVEMLIDDPACRAALDDLLEHLVPAGRMNSLAALALTLAGPGVPDLYQGSLGWRLSLADPDNRNDPDLEREASLLEEARREGGRCWSGASIVGDERGVAKAHLISRGLAVRRTYPGCFAPGAAYHPLAADGPAADHVIAYTMVAADGGARGHEVPRLVVVAVRLATTLRRVRRPDDDVWARTYIDLPDGVWRDVLVDPPAGVSIDAHCGRVDLASLVGDRPAALLARV